MKDGFYSSQDINGNIWPNWMVEKATPGPTQELVRIFNLIFYERHPGNLLYPHLNYLGMPLPDDTEYYMIHNQEYFLAFTELVHMRSRRCTNEYCEISLAYTQLNGYPALTGQGLGRVCQVVAPKYDEPSKSAIYRLDVPKTLSLAATEYDEDDKWDRFEEWDSNGTPLRSPVPSRGRALRSETSGTMGYGGWGHTSTTAGRYSRPTLRQLAKMQYKGE